MSELERSSEYVSAQQRDGLKVSFHPAFARHCFVAQGGSGEEAVYRQSSPYRVPPGLQGPPKKHRIRIEGGPLQRDVTILVEDPHGQVAEVTIKLYGPEHSPGSGDGDEPVETVRVQNDAIHCPPNCDAEL